MLAAAECSVRTKKMLQQAELHVRVAKWCETKFAFPKLDKRKYVNPGTDNVDYDESSDSNDEPRRSSREARGVTSKRFGTTLHSFAKLMAMADAKIREIENVPATHRQMLKSSEYQKWAPAVESELNSLRERKTWNIVERPDGHKIIDSRWIFRKKINPDGSIRHKARLVARGFK